VATVARAWAASRCPPPCPGGASAAGGRAVAEGGCACDGHRRWPRSRKAGATTAIPRNGYRRRRRCATPTLWSAVWWTCGSTSSVTVSRRRRTDRTRSWCSVRRRRHRTNNLSRQNSRRRDPAHAQK